MSPPRRSRFFLAVPAGAVLPARARSRLRLILAAMAALGFAGCAQEPQQLAATSHGKEYFPSSKYGPISRRVIADGQPVPHGGGQYLVGKPYTVAGQTYYPSERHIVQVGNASWYGDAFHGRLTANGEIYDRNGFTAAHPTLPLPSYARVTNLRNNTSMIVRVNDRGPYASNRVMDVSGGVAEALDFKRTGTAKVKVEYIARASLAGSDDAKLLATLRVNAPAQWPGEPVTAVAEVEPSTRVASASFRPEGDRPARYGSERDEIRAISAPRRPRRAPPLEAETVARGRAGDHRPPVSREQRALPDPRGELDRLIARNEGGVRTGTNGRPTRVAASEPTPDRSGSERSGRTGSERFGRPGAETARLAVPPRRPSRADIARGGGRGPTELRGFQQAGLQHAGLRLAASRDD